MPYCVNCGQEYKNNNEICNYCYLSTVQLKENIEKLLNKYSLTSNTLSDCSYYGEKTSLFFSISILVLLTIALGSLTLGGFIFVLLSLILSNKVAAAQHKASMLQVSENSYPHIYNIVKTVAFNLKAPLVPVYISQDPTYNAHTQGFFNNCWIVINSTIIEDFSAKEIAFVIGHEYGHILKKHTTWLSLLSSTGTNIFSSLITLIQMIFNIWSLKCEYTADRIGLIAIRDSNASINTLLKLSSGKNASNVDWKELLKQQDKKEDFLLKITELFGTHPYTINRLKQIDIFSRSDKYRYALEKTL